MQQLTGKVAIVTGASKGIGAAIAKALAAAGAAVVVNYSSSRAGAERVSAEITAAGGQAAVIGGSVRDGAAVRALIDGTIERFGRLDILVNNAGVYQMAPLEQVTEESFHQQFDTNVLGLLLATQAALPRFGPAGGSVINISSAITTLAPPNASVYSATKGAVDVATRSLAAEFGPRGIRVNAINPGYVRTEGTADIGLTGSEMEQQFIAMTPLGRAGEPDDIADVAVFLASDQARWVTGQTIQVSGGLK